MKKMFSTLMVMFIIAILGGAFGSCESNEVNTTSDSSEVKIPLNWTFKYDTSRVNGKFVVNYTITETTVGFTETGKAYMWCDHERDGYAGPRDASLQYSQSNTNQGAVKSVQKSATPEKEVYIDSAKTTSLTECGNVINCYRVQERIVRIINGKRYELPYIKINNPSLEKLDLLPGTAKTRADEEVITDSVCRSPGWKATCEVANYAKDASKFDVRLNDLFKVYQLSANEIKSGKIIGTDRVPITDTEERCDVNIEWTKTDGSTHNSTVSKILKRSITPKPRWEVFVKEYGFKWQRDKDVVVGEAKKVESASDANWNVYGRIDQFGAVLANGVDPNIDTEYSLYHEKAEYKNEQYGMSHVFDFVSFNPQEKSTEESEITSARDGYTSRLLKNTISTSYLGHAQNADESAVLYKDADDEPTYDDWLDTKSFETIFDEYTLWHTEYLYEKGDVSEVTVFEWKQPRSLEYLGPWISIEENNTYETSGVSVEVESSEPVEEEQNGAKAKWNIRTFSLQATVSLAGSKQYDKWRAKEGNNFTVTYRGKTLTIERKGYRVNNVTDLKDNGVRGEYNEWGYSNVLEYRWGDNTKYSTATGTIKVLVPKQEDKFFPPDWGSLLDVKQTNTNSKGHNGSLPVWSLRFDKGVLPVIINPGNDVPNWDFSLFEYTTVTDYNSATYVITDDTWVNTTAEDRPSYMVWERNHKEYANKDYNEAGKETWDDGHTVNGHPSVYTSRYRLELEKGCLTATDTYTGRYMGSWK